MSRHDPRSWLRKTGQHWKYLVSWLLVLTSAVAFVPFVVDINTDEDSPGRYAGDVPTPAGCTFGRNRTMHMLHFHPEHAPRRKLRGKRRYFERVRHDAEAFVMSPKPEEWVGSAKP